MITNYVYNLYSARITSGPSPTKIVDVETLLHIAIEQSNIKVIWKTIKSSPKIKSYSIEHLVILSLVSIVGCSLRNLDRDLVLSSTVRMEIVTFPDDLHENYCHFLLKQKIAHS